MRRNANLERLQGLVLIDLVIVGLMSCFFFALLEICERDSVIVEGSVNCLVRIAARTFGFERSLAS